MGAFDDLQSIPPQMLADGYLARAVHGERLTFAVVEVEPGAELPEHHHDNEQFGIVVEGSVIFRVGDEERSLSAGGIWRIPSDTPHSVIAGDAGAVVFDIFSPPRKDGQLSNPSHRVHPPGRNTHRSRTSFLTATPGVTEPIPARLRQCAGMSLEAVLRGLPE